MKNKTIVINGEAWCRNLTGIERFTIEVVTYLDKMVKKDSMELVLPANAKNVPELQNIKIVKLNKEAHFFPRWTLIDFQKYALKKRAITFNFANTCPLFSPNITVLHDIYCQLYKNDFKSKKDKLIRLYSTFMYRWVAKHAIKVFTVSEYTKKTITDAYHVNPDKIEVVYDGVSQYNEIKADNSIFEKFPALKEKEFYFTLGSLSNRKNLKWIARHAEKYQNETFVISGKALVGSLVPQELKKLATLPNVIMAGYLQDAEVKALFTKAKAFIFPSYFEGFGIPPLEALSCGCPVIISNSSCLPEIYGNCAHYIDPDNSDINLDELLKEHVENADKLFEKYSFEKSAKRIYDSLKKIETIDI